MNGHGDLHQAPRVEQMGAERSGGPDRLQLREVGAPIALGQLATFMDGRLPPMLPPDPDRAAEPVATGCDRDPG